MSMSDLEQALKLITDNDDAADFVGPRSENLIKVAQETLGVRFPETYLKFLRELGCGDIGGQEFYGIISENFEDSGVPDAI